MGTTQDAIRGGAGVELGFVLCIEGYKYLLTDGLATDATTAWAATSWSNALPGLEVNFNDNQRLSPWSNELSVRNMSVAVVPESTDQFGIDMFKRKPDVRSELTVSIASDDDGGSGFNITVKDASIFAAGEPVMIGNETYNVTGTPSGTTIPVPAGGSGYFHPFAGDGLTNRLPGAHNIAPNANVNNVDVNAPVYVSDAPATWIGKKVALHVHRIVGGTWDTHAQSEVWFAGTIDAIGQDGLKTTLECTGIEQQLIDAQILADQWSGQLKEGFVFESGDFVRALFSTGTPKPSADFTAGTDFTAGRYTVEEFASMLAEHLDGDGAIGISGTDFTLRWSAMVNSSNNGQRFVLTAQEGSSVAGSIHLIASKPSILEWLGFENVHQSHLASGLPAKLGPVEESANISLVSDKAPYRVSPLGPHGTTTIELEDTDGTFADYTSLLPPAAKEHSNAGGTWSYYAIGDNLLFLGKRDSDTQISGITVDVPLTDLAKGNSGKDPLRMSTRGKARVRQILFASSTFANIITKLFASTDGNGTNHTNHDIFPFGGGIPWSLLGTNFIDSLEALEQHGVDNGMCLIVDKPTRLWEAVKSDFILRMAQPVWKDGGIRVASLTVPNASTADHTLNETNKSDGRRTTYSETNAFSAHTLKVEIDRNPLSGKYMDQIIVRNLEAYEAAGGAGPVKTIKARNSYSGIHASGAAAEALADMIAARFLPVFGKPLKLWTRSVPHTLFHMAPGDTVSFSDDFVRAPDTGARGVSVRPAIVTSVSSSFGISSSGQTYHGEVELMYTEEDRLFPLAPSCEHATATGSGYTDGWDSGNTKLLVHQHKFSDTTENTDAQSYASGDAVRITELDPADPASADSFADTLASAPSIGTVTISTVDYDELELTNGFGAGGRPAFDSTKTYIVNFDDYDQGQDAQLLFAYQADDSDGRIQNLQDPNLVGDETKLGSADADITLLPSRHAAEQYGDGKPLSASFMRDQARMANNLVHYQCTSHSPMMSESIIGVNTGGASDFRTIWIFPWLIGYGQTPGAGARKLNVAPMFATASGGTTVQVRVTSSANPPKGASTGGFLNTTWTGPKQQVTYSTSSATQAVATAQELNLVRAEGIPEFTWITVEGDNLCEFYGLAEFWLGPVQ